MIPPRVIGTTSLDSLNRQSFPIVFAVVGLVLIVGTVMRERHRNELRERERLLEVFDQARQMGFQIGERRDEEEFLKILEGTRLRGSGKQARVRHCFEGTRHQVEVRVCDFFGNEGSQTVVAFRVPPVRHTRFRALRHGWEIEPSGPWLLLYRPGDNGTSDLSSFLARAEALARPQVVQIHDLPAPLTPLPNDGSVASAREEERRWKAFFQLKEWSAFLTRVVELQLAEQRLSPEKPVSAYSCAPVPTLSARELASAPLGYHRLAESAEAGLEDVIALLSSTSYGRPVVSRFLTRYHRGEIQIHQMTSLLRGARSGAPALFVYRPDTRSKIIYVDKKTPVGLLAPVLFHEIVHSLDDEHQRAVDRQEQLMADFAQQGSEVLRDTAERVRRPMVRLSPADFETPAIEEMASIKQTIDEMADIAIYRTEKRAADAEYLVTQELLSRYPRFYYHLRRGGRETHYLSIQVSGDDVIRRYALNRIYIEKYLKGLCLSLPQ